MMSLLPSEPARARCQAAIADLSAWRELIGKAIELLTALSGPPASAPVAVREAAPVRRPARARAMKAVRRASRVPNATPPRRLKSPALKPPATLAKTAVLPPVTAAPLAGSLKARIVEALRTEGAPMRARDLATALRANFDSLRAALYSLRDAGVVTLKGHRSAAKWSLAGAPAAPKMVTMPAPRNGTETVWNGAMDRSGTAKSLIGSER